MNTAIVVEVDGDRPTAVTASFDIIPTQVLYRRLTFLTGSNASLPVAGTHARHVIMTNPTAIWHHPITRYAQIVVDQRHGVCGRCRRVGVVSFPP